MHTKILSAFDILINKNLIQWPQLIYPSNSICQQILKLWNTENAELCLNFFHLLFFYFSFFKLSCMLTFLMYANCIFKQIIHSNLNKIQRNICIFVTIKYRGLSCNSWWSTSLLLLCTGFKRHLWELFCDYWDSQRCFIVLSDLLLLWSSLQIVGKNWNGSPYKLTFLPEDWMVVLLLPHGTRKTDINFLAFFKFTEWIHAAVRDWLLFLFTCCPTFQST